MTANRILLGIFCFIAMISIVSILGAFTSRDKKKEKRGEAVVLLDKILPIFTRYDPAKNQDIETFELILDEFYLIISPHCDLQCKYSESVHCKGLIDINTIVLHTAIVRNYVRIREGIKQ